MIVARLEYVMEVLLGEFWNDVDLDDGQRLPDTGVDRAHRCRKHANDGISDVVLHNQASAEYFDIDRHAPTVRRCGCTGGAVSWGAGLVF
jgi:hypothetical protein